jgi:lipoprotein-anchoring transpeptidase ErfK/SrfK
LSAIDGALLFFAQALQRAHAAAIFFDYGFAIHGSNDILRLGGPPSHGCVRLHPANAATLFAPVEHNGPRNTRIEISNQSEGGLLTVR